jgi:hypothetical protein
MVGSEAPGARSEWLVNFHEELATRLAVLAPVMREYERLNAAAAALGAISTAQSAPRPGPTPRAHPPTRPQPPRPPRLGRSCAPSAPRAQALAASTRSAPPAPSRRTALERHPTPALAAAALALVTAEPGQAIPELAVRLVSLQNPLYAILRAHERAGRLVKSGRRWHPSPGL